MDAATAFPILPRSLEPISPPAAGHSVSMGPFVAVRATLSPVQDSPRWIACSIPPPDLDRKCCWNVLLTSCTPLKDEVGDIGGSTVPEVNGRVNACVGLTELRGSSAVFVCLPSWTTGSNNENDVGEAASDILGQAYSQRKLNTSVPALEMPTSTLPSPFRTLAGIFSPLRSSTIFLSDLSGSL